MACNVTSGIDHGYLDSMSICLESQSAFQWLFLDPVFDRYNIVNFFKCVAILSLIEHVI